MIIAEPQGGLANRIRVIASCIWLKKELNTELVVIWNENYELNCPYELLFGESMEFSIVKKKKKFNYLRASNAGTRMKCATSKLVNLALGVGYFLRENDFHTLVWTGKLDILETARRYKVTYIQTCQEFGDNLPAFRTFNPIQPLQKQINHVCESFTELTIGVHIRRTDHISASTYSPDELFLTKMKLEISKHMETTFFLCTDDEKTEALVVREFGPRVIIYKKELSRQSVRGVQDAVVDLFCLSKTNKILGSYWSSFSDIASRINQTELDVLKTIESS